MAYKGKFKPIHPEKYHGNPCNIIYRSLWEFKFMKYLDEHQDIRLWSSEEFFIPYISPMDNRYHRYFPDFKVKFIDKFKEEKIVVYEVKPKAQTLPPIKGKKTNKRYLNEVMEYGKNMAKFEAAQKYCDGNNWEFKVITEKELGIR